MMVRSCRRAAALAIFAKARTNNATSVKMSSMEPNPMPRLVDALHGFEAARERVVDAGVNPDTSFVPLTEACWWAVCIHEGLRLHGADAYDKGWREHEGGQVVRGLVYARNMLGHARVTTVERGGGMTFPMTFPLAFTNELRWLPADALPEPERPQPDNRRACVDFVAGKEVTGTLLLASAWLHGAVGVLGMRLDAMACGEDPDDVDDVDDDVTQERIGLDYCGRLRLCRPHAHDTVGVQPSDHAQRALATRRSACNASAVRYTHMDRYARSLERDDGAHIDR
jgi:hypothetical protein